MSKAYFKLRPVEEGSLVRIPYNAGVNEESISLLALLNKGFKAFAIRSGVTSISAARFAGVIFPKGQVETMSGKSFNNQNSLKMARAKFAVTEPSGEGLKCNVSGSTPAFTAGTGFNDKTFNIKVDEAVSSVGISDYIYIDLIVRFGN